MNLARTKAALIAYDLAMVEIDQRLFEAKTSEEMQQLFHEIDELGERVGAAYAADTNKPNVARYIRPDAWLRSLVQKYGGAAS